MAQFDFDTNEVEARAPAALLPAGWYEGLVIESDVKPTKSGGESVNLTVEITTTGYRGRRVWLRLNTKNANPDAERIGKQQLRELCEAVGVTRLTNTDNLHNKPFGLKVKIRKSSDPQYEDSNEAQAFRPAGAGGTAAAPIPAQRSFTAPPAANSAPAAAPAAAATATASPPWAKKA